MPQDHLILPKIKRFTQPGNPVYEEGHDHWIRLYIFKEKYFYLPNFNFLIRCKSLTYLDAKRG